MSGSSSIIECQVHSLLLSFLNVLLVVHENVHKHGSAIWQSYLFLTGPKGPGFLG